MKKKNQGSPLASTNVVIVVTSKPSAPKNNKQARPVRALLSWLLTAVVPLLLLSIFTSSKNLNLTNSGPLATSKNAEDSALIQQHISTRQKQQQQQVNSTDNEEFDVPLLSTMTMTRQTNPRQQEDPAEGQSLETKDDSFSVAMTLTTEAENQTDVKEDEDESIISSNLSLPPPLLSSIMLEHLQNKYWTLTEFDDWIIIPPNATKHPYNRYAPHLDIIWARGWYNSPIDLPASIPLSYYNRYKLDSIVRLGRGKHDIYWHPDSLCHQRPQGSNNTNTTTNPMYVWIRAADMDKFFQRLVFTSTSKKEQQSRQRRLLLPDSCRVILVVSDGDADMPGIVFKKLLKKKQIFQWYAQNVAGIHQKLTPLPIGFCFQDSCPRKLKGRLGVVESVQRLIQARRDYTTAQKWHPNNTAEAGGGVYFNHYHRILIETGTINFCRRRIRIRTQLQNVQAQTCPNTLPYVLSLTSVEQAWQQFASYHFVTAPTGCGYDTFRVWELLFLGTVPIVLSTELDHLLLPAHVPVLIVDDWNELCHLASNATLYGQMIQRYKTWIQYSHLWLQPGLWLPRNQVRMDWLCRQFTGCVEAHAMDFRMTHRPRTMYRVKWYSQMNWFGSDFATSYYHPQQHKEFHGSFLDDRNNTALAVTKH